MGIGGMGRKEGAYKTTLPIRNAPTITLMHPTISSAGFDRVSAILLLFYNRLQRLLIDNALSAGYNTLSALDAAVEIDGAIVAALCGGVRA